MVPLEVVISRLLSGGPESQPAGNGPLREGVTSVVGEVGVSGPMPLLLLLAGYLNTKDGLLVSTSRSPGLSTGWVPPGGGDGRADHQRFLQVFARAVIRIKQHRAARSRRRCCSQQDPQLGQGAAALLVVDGDKQIARGVDRQPVRIDRARAPRPAEHHGAASRITGVEVARITDNEAAPGYPRPARSSSYIGGLGLG